MGEPGVIRKLSEEVVNRIAAGEIVQRPANALKELIENSMDAKSTNIIITVKAGGLKYLQIQDNGTGIRQSDLPILCERFTTSKLREYNDLQSIATYGFRGEALASISHIAHLTVLTKTAKDRCAYKVSYDIGIVKGAIKPCAGNNGTQITVEDLFYNVLARKKSLRSPSEEYSHIMEVVGSYAIHNSHVGFTLKKFGENTDIRTPINSSVVENVRVIHGNSIARELMEISSSEPTLKMKINGFITNVNYSHKKGTLLLFINHRLVDSSAIRKAVDSVYSTYLPKNAHSFVYLSLELDPKNVDVNVHPTKHEVQFLYEEQIIEKIKACVESKLLGCNSTRVMYTQARLPGATMVEDIVKKTTDSAKEYAYNMVRVQSDTQKIDKFFQAAPKNVFTRNKDKNNAVIGSEKTLIGNDKTVMGHEKTVIGNDKTVMGNQKTVIESDKTVIGNDKTDIGNDKNIKDGFINKDKVIFDDDEMNTVNTKMKQKLEDHSVTKDKTVTENKFSNFAMDIDDIFGDDEDTEITIPKKPDKTTENQITAPKMADKTTEAPNQVQTSLIEEPSGFNNEMPEKWKANNNLDQANMNYIDPKESFKTRAFKHERVDTKLTSVKQMRLQVENECNTNLREILANLIFIACIDCRKSLIQHSTKLYLCDTTKLTEELFYETMLYDFQNFGLIKLSNPLPLQELFMLGLNASEEWNPELGDMREMANQMTEMLVDKRAMLLEYFSMEINKEGELLALPVLLDGHTPFMGALPTYLVRLVTEVDWNSERECFDTFIRQTAVFYSQPNPDSSVEALKSELWRQEHVIFPAIRRYFIPPTRFVHNGAVLQIASLADLYKVFERC